MGDTWTWELFREEWEAVGLGMKSEELAVVTGILRWMLERVVPV